MAEYNPSKIIKDGNTYNFRDTTKIPLAGSNQISGSLVPSTDGTVNLGSVSYQWNNAYIKSLTINGVACGDILTHNASEFVDVTSGQTIAGIKSFSDIPIVVNGKTYTSQISADRINGRKSDFSANNGFKIICDQNSDAWNNTAFAIHLTDYAPTTGQINFKLYDCIENGTSYKGFFFKKDGNDFQLSPTGSNSTDLGSSTNKWKSLNGIAPDELGLPTSTYTDVSSYITNFDSTPNAFTAPVSGLFFIDGSNLSNSVSCAVTNITKGYSINFAYAYGHMRGFIPVEKGDLIRVFIDIQVTVESAKIYHLKGKI